MNEGLGLTRPRASWFMTGHKASTFKPPKRAVGGAAEVLTIPPPCTLLKEGETMLGRWFHELTDASRRKAPGSCCEAQT